MIVTKKGWTRYHYLKCHLCHQLSLRCQVVDPALVEHDNDSDEEGVDEISLPEMPPVPPAVPQVPPMPPPPLDPHNGLRRSTRSRNRVTHYGQNIYEN